MTTDFTVVLRGFDRLQVEALLAKADAAIATGDRAERAALLPVLERLDLTVVLRGYDRGQVEAAAQERLVRLGSTATVVSSSKSYEFAPTPPPPVPFVVVFRGYNRAEVDEIFGRVEAAVGSADPFVRAAAREALRAAEFTVALRGYDRKAVDAARQEALQKLF